MSDEDASSHARAWGIRVALGLAVAILFTYVLGILAHEPPLAADQLMDRLTSAVGIALIVGPATGFIMAYQLYYRSRRK